MGREGSRGGREALRTLTCIYGFRVSGLGPIGLLACNVNILRYSFVGFRGMD